MRLALVVNRADKDAACAQLAQQPHGLTEHGCAPPVERDLCACGKAFRAAESEGTDGRLLGAGNAAEPVVPAVRAIEADVEAAAHPALLQCAQQLLGDECAIGHDRGNLHAALRQPVNDLQEVGAVERLTTGELDNLHAARCHLVGDAQALLGRGLGQELVRRAHEAVPAPVVAPPREGPLDLPHVMVGIEAILLLGLESARFVREGERPLALQLHKLGLPRAKEDGVRGAEGPVAQLQRVEDTLGDEVGCRRQGVEECIGLAEPPAQPEAGVYPHVPVCAVCVHASCSLQRATGGTPQLLPERAYPLPNNEHSWGQ